MQQCAILVGVEKGVMNASEKPNDSLSVIAPLLHTLGILLF